MNTFARLTKAKRRWSTIFLRDPTGSHSHPRRNWAADIWSQVFGARTAE